jgi:hypothetical protein
MENTLATKIICEYFNCLQYADFELDNRRKLYYFNAIRRNQDEIIQTQQLINSLMKKSKCQQKNKNTWMNPPVKRHFHH